MPLTWDLSGIKDYEALCFVDAGVDDKGEKLTRLHPVTNAIIWATMNMGLRLTEKNLPDFLARMRLAQKLIGPMGPGGVAITDEQVRAHVGLYTNVSDEPVDTWLKRQVAYEYEQAFAAGTKALGIEAKCPVDRYKAKWGGRGR